VSHLRSKTPLTCSDRLRGPLGRSDMDHPNSLAASPSSQCPPELRLLALGRSRAPPSSLSSAGPWRPAFALPCSLRRAAEARRGAPIAGATPPPPPPQLARAPAARSGGVARRGAAGEPRARGAEVARARATAGSRSGGGVRSGHRRTRSTATRCSLPPPAEEGGGRVGAAAREGRRRRGWGGREREAVHVGSESILDPSWLST